MWAGRARDVLVLASRDGKLLDGALGMLTGADGAQLLAKPGNDGVASWAGRMVNIRVRATAASGGVPVAIEPGEGQHEVDQIFDPAVRRRQSLVEPHLKRVATLQHPTATCRLARIEQAREKAIECDLASQAMEINGVATRPFEQACLEGGP